MAPTSFRPPAKKSGGRGGAGKSSPKSGPTARRGKSAATGKKKAAPPKTPASRGGTSQARKKAVSVFNKKFLLLLCFLVGISTGAVLFWYFNNSPSATPPDAATARVSTAPAPSSPPPPARQLYEEPASRELLQVDNAIYSALARAGVEQSHIKLWIDLTGNGEISRLEVNLNDQQKLESVAASLNQALGGSNASGKWQKQQNFWHLEVSLDKQLTHQVNLRKQPGPPEVVARKPKVAIIVDDVGLNSEALNQLLGLQMELTFSVLPYAPNAAQVARKITGQGRELWMHLPMEPLGRYNNPGPGALYTNMSQQQLSQLTQQALDRVPGAVGVNNHMGSKFTQDAISLAGPLQVLNSHNLMFIDSVTSPRSVAAAMAREMGLLTGQRDIFLDHEVKEPAIVQQIAKLIRLAKSKGSAIAICHPHAATIAALKQAKPLLAQMVELVPASRLLESP